jgi:hypothetical protein
LGKEYAFTAQPFFSRVESQSVIISLRKSGERFLYRVTAIPKMGQRCMPGLSSF